MKFVAIDIETTGLNKELDHVLQIALVVEDTHNPHTPVEDLPTFEALIWYDRISGSPFALNMNREIVELLATARPGPVDFRDRRVDVYERLNEALFTAIAWLDMLYDNGKALVKPTKFVAAGKNAAGFDLPFLGPDFQKHFHHRVIDVGSVALGANRSGAFWQEDRPPGMRELHENDEPTHDALEDARDVVRLLRKLTHNYR